MTHREIRAMLRGAVAADVLEGWYFTGNLIFGGESIRYIVNPPASPTSTYTIAETVAYCQMLAEAGIEPVYRN